MSKFVEIAPEELNENVFRRIGAEWMLITAGDRKACNTMTASWGGLGVLWNANVSFAFVRPSRYTFGFMEEKDCYSLSFFGNGYRRELKLCGTTSGRDGDKIADAGLTPMFDAQAPYFDEAELVLICRKMYTDDIKPENFLDGTIKNCYPGDTDYHRVYVGEIVKVLKRV